MLNKTKKHQLRRPSIFFYVAAFLTVGIVSLSVTTMIALSQLENIRIELKESNREIAKNELKDALVKLLKKSKSITTSFASWEETLQQFHNPTYYNYWRTNRVNSVNFLPTYFNKVELYDRHGAPLAPLRDKIMPKTIQKQERSSLIIKDNETYILLHCSSIRPDSSNQTIYGYTCITLNLIQGIKDIEHFHNLDTNLVTINLPNRTNTIEYKHAIDYMQVKIRSNHYINTLEELVLKTLEIFFALGTIMLFGFSYILIAPVGNPLRSLSAYIDTLSKPGNRISSRTKINRFFAASEIEKIYLSLDDYRDRLEASSSNLRKSEEHFRSLIENSSDVIAIIDSDGIILYCSPSIKRVLKYDEKDLINRSLLEFIHNKDKDSVQNSLQTIVSQTATLYLPEFKFRDKNGTWRILEAIAKPFPAHDDTTKIIINSRDITNKKRAASELEKTRDKALEANRIKSEFLANMSHELRTPLNAIMGYSQLLLAEIDDVDKERLQHDTTIMYKSGKHLLKLINEVLDISKIEAGKLVLQPEHFDITALVQDVVATVQPMNENNDNKLVTSFPPSLGSMYNDKTKVQQILLNILSNAAKFTSGGTIEINVRRENTAEDEWILFVISDTGFGMTSDQLDKVFDPFYQADASLTRTYSGTGLGLAISKRFCELMDGTIFVASEPDKGTIFSVKLPLNITSVKQTIQDGHDASGNKM